MWGLTSSSDACGAGDRRDLFVFKQTGVCGETDICPLPFREESEAVPAAEAVTRHSDLGNASLSAKVFNREFVDRFRILYSLMRN